MFMLLIQSLCILLSIMFFTLFERKIMASSQNRLGPFRLLQALQDGLKLFFKSTFVLPSFNVFLFILSSMIFLVCALSIWISIYNFQNFMFVFLFVLIIQAISVYMPLIISVSSNSKYSTLAAVRSIIQMISYDITISVVIFSVSFPLFMMSWPSYSSYFFLLLPMMMIWIVSMLAEMNRTPFDLVEAESELVSGFNVEYSGIPFAMIFLGEYSYILFFSFYSSFLFGFFFFFFFFMIFVYSRLVFPRLRYDALVILCWQKLLPISLFFLAVFIFIM